MPNQLQYEKSPYLLQHAENPVEWLPWGRDAFQRAAREDKPIFLSIGYSTCHWCHVMAHESFESEEAAQVLNRNFIPIKVDREERPDVDAVYMAACMAMNGSGGWPLTVLLTPEQKPFWAGTYLPRQQLLSLLEMAARLWREDRGRLTAAGEALTEALNRQEEARPGRPDRKLAEAGAALFAQSFDVQWGGFGQAPKFPAGHNLLFLLRYAALSGDQSAREMAEQTLEHIYRGGIFDHVGGGFSRYSTDRQWLLPHFEKMLYDNALLALAYTEAFQQTGRPYARRVVRRTLDYVLRELVGPQGGFCCGQDADSEGAEGKYYVFAPEELTPVLGRGEAEAFCRRFHIAAPGYFEGGCIPHLIGTPDWEGEAPEMEEIQTQVYEYRKGRTWLHRDDKVLPAWNGLVIAALARAGLVLGEERYLKAAEEAADFIEGHLTDAGGRLLARWREGQAAYPGKLEDYAFYGWGLLELYGVTFQTRFLEGAVRAAGHLLDLFFDGEKGGFYPYAKDGEQLITRTKETYDGAMPSGNSAAALLLSRLARLTGEERWRGAADLQFSYLAGAAGENPMGHSFALMAMLEELWPTQELICTAGEVPAELLFLLREKPGNGTSVLVKTRANEGELAALAPFTKEYPVPTAGERYYLCRGGSCLRPFDSITALRAALSENENRG